MGRLIPSKRKKGKEKIATHESSKRSFTRKDLLLLCSVVTLSFFLNVLGFGWGMDGRVPWAPDAIEGITTVREMPKLFGKWTYKYPRLQFLIDGLCYQPFIKHWEKDPAYVRQFNQPLTTSLTLPQMKTLATISRINILWISTLTIILVYLIAKFYYADPIAAFFASLSLAVCYMFVYYSHTSCVDIPSMLWISAGVYFLIKSIYQDKPLHHILAGLFFAFACCTKDAMLFYAFAFAVTYLVMKIHRHIQEGGSIKRCLPVILNKNSIAALIVFLFFFALLQGILASPKDYWERMGVWVGGRGINDFNQDFKGQWPLLVKTSKLIYQTVGWPLLGLWIVSLIFSKAKHRVFHFVFALFPLVFFYLAVSMRIKMSYERYYLPILGIMFLPIGGLASQLFSIRKKQLKMASIFGMSALLVLSFLFCIALDLELLNDPRTRTADWFKDNVSKDTIVINLVRNWYGPKLQIHGYRVILNWKVPPLQVLRNNIDKLPEYIVLTPYLWRTLESTEAKEYQAALLADGAGFSEAAQFRSKNFVNPRKCPLALACWPVNPNLGVGFPIVVMKKNPPE